MDKSDDAKIVDLAIRLAFLGLFIFSAVAMVAPLSSVVIWGLILCVALYPAYDWLQKKLGGRRTLASTMFILVGLVVTLGPLASAVTAMLDMGAIVSERTSAGNISVPPLPTWLTDIPLVGPKIMDVWVQFDRSFSDAMTRYAPQILEFMGTLLGTAAGIGVSLLSLALSVVIMGILFAPGPNLAKGVQKFANRVFAPRGGEFVLMAGATVRNVTKGVIGVAAIQAVCVWILLWAFGFKSAAALALVCLILSIIQLGPLIVLIPVAIYAWTSMSGGAALAFTVLAVPVGIMDGFLRPVFISKGLDTPMLVILIGVIGGMMAYGLIGVFMGPVLLAVLYELFVLWISADVEPEGTVGGDVE